MPKLRLLHLPGELFYKILRYERKIKKISWEGLCTPFVSGYKQKLANKVDILGLNYVFSFGLNTLLSLVIWENLSLSLRKNIFRILTL